MTERIKVRVLDEERNEICAFEATNVPDVGDEVHAFNGPGGTGVEKYRWVVTGRVWQLQRTRTEVPPDPANCDLQCVWLHVRLQGFSGLVAVGDTE